MMIPIFHQIQNMEEAAIMRTALVDRKGRQIRLGHGEWMGGKVVILFLQ